MHSYSLKLSPSLDENRGHEATHFSWLGPRTLAKQQFFLLFVAYQRWHFYTHINCIQLSYNQTLPSHTSLQVNTSLVPLSPVRFLPVVDVPGHPRIRDQFQEHLTTTRAVAFVVDASTISRNGSIVAECVNKIGSLITRANAVQRVDTYTMSFMP